MLAGPVALYERDDDNVAIANSMALAPKDMAQEMKNSKLAEAAVVDDRVRRVRNRHYKAK